VKQVRIKRSSRRSGGPEATDDLSVPTRPASDTSASADLLSRIERELAA
jgi:hypothetical protein